MCGLKFTQQECQFSCTLTYNYTNNNKKMHYDLRGKIVAFSTNGKYAKSNQELLQIEKNRYRIRTNHSQNKHMSSASLISKKNIN